MECSLVASQTRVVLGRQNGRPCAVMARDRLAARFVAADALLGGEWEPEALATPDGDILLEGPAFRAFSHALLFGWGYVSVNGLWISPWRPHSAPHDA